jgi:hypothetical protein
VSIQHPEMASAVASDPARLLEELKRIAVEQLGAVPGGLYRPIEEQLHESLRVGNEGGHRKDLMTVLALRQRGSGYVMRFRELIGRSFDDFCGRAMPGTASSPMGLVRENELEFHLAGQRLAESIGRRYQRPLEMLGLRFESLGAALGVPGSANPVGASLLANAFVQTFRDAEVSNSLQPLLFRQYEQELAKVLGELYGRLNTQLAASGFHADPRRMAAVPAAADTLPQVPVATPTQAANTNIMSSRQAGAWLEAGIGGAVPSASPAPVATPARPQQPAAAPSQAASAPASNPEMFRGPAGQRVQHQQLRDMLHLWREGMLGEQSIPSEHAPERRLAERRELRIQEVVSVASLLQRDGARNFEAALAGKCDLHDAIREELVEGARRLGLDPDRTCLDQHQEDAIDLTGMLFQAMLKSHSLLQDSRRLFARLVMSYVKVALTDDSLFVRDDHPARRMLDALALSCESNDGASPQDRDLLARAGKLVDKVVAEYNEDLAIFDLAASELQDLLQQQRRRAEIIERRASESVHGRERLMHARRVAADALARRLEGRELTQTVAHFLERHWQHHLVQVLLREGEGSQRHRRVLALADELVAVDAAAARAGGADVAERVLSLHAGLVDSLSSSGLDEQVAGEWMAGLARTLAFPDVPREQRQPAPVAATAPDDVDDGPLMRVVGGTDRLDYDMAVAERMRTLRVGDWMRLSDDRGNEGSVKVAWISPLTSRLLLVNRRGLRQLVASPEQLAALVRSGHLFAEADEMPFDEAMRLVRQKLGRSAARAA